MARAMNHPVFARLPLDLIMLTRFFLSFIADLYTDHPITCQQVIARLSFLVQHRFGFHLRFPGLLYTINGELHCLRPGSSICDISRTDVNSLTSIFSTTRIVNSVGVDPVLISESYSLECFDKGPT